MTSRRADTTPITRLRANSHGAAIALKDTCCGGSSQVQQQDADPQSISQIYNVASTPHISRPRLLVEARVALLKYNLSTSDLEVTSAALAHTMRNHLEQKGIRTLPAELMDRIEHEVLAYCGIGTITPQIL